MLALCSIKANDYTHFCILDNNEPTSLLHEQFLIHQHKFHSRYSPDLAERRGMRSI